MTDTNTRVEHLLNSNVGCAFVALLDLNYLTPQDMENQKTMLHIAADCADFLDRNRADHEIIVPGVRALANEKADQARAHRTSRHRLVVRAARLEPPSLALRALGSGQVHLWNAAQYR